MANVKITELSPAFTPLWGTELIEIVQGGVNKQVEVNEVGGGGGVTEFIELTDVPASYTGQASKVVAVKADETGLEFVAGGGGTTPTLQEVLTEGNNANGLEIILSDISGDIQKISATSGDINIDSDAYGVHIRADAGLTVDNGISVQNGIIIQNGLAGGVILNSSNTTAGRYVEFPDKDGTIAFLDDITGGAVDSVNGQTGVVVLDSDDISEGATNLYFTDARALGAIPDATPTVKGIAKLYTSLGSNTDGAVDQNTVNSALALKANLQNVEQIIRSKSNGTFGSHTGDTAETVIAVIDIDANEFEAGDWSSLYVFTEKNGTAGTLTIRLRAGINGNTSDALIATSSATSPNSRYLSLSRLSPRFLTGNLLNIFSPTTASSTDIGTSNSNTTSVSLTPSSAWKLTITAQLGSSGETVSLTGYRIGKIKSF